MRCERALASRFKGHSLSSRHTNTQLITVIFHFSIRDQQPQWISEMRTYTVLRVFVPFFRSNCVAAFLKSRPSQAASRLKLLLLLPARFTHTGTDLASQPFGTLWKPLAGESVAAAAFAGPLEQTRFVPRDSQQRLACQLDGGLRSRRAPREFAESRKIR